MIPSPRVNPCQLGQSTQTCASDSTNAIPHGPRKVDRGGGGIELGMCCRHQNHLFSFLIHTPPHSYHHTILSNPCSTPPIVPSSLCVFTGAGGPGHEHWGIAFWDSWKLLAPPESSFQQLLRLGHGLCHTFHVMSILTFSFSKVTESYACRPSLGPRRLQICQ